MHRANQLTIGAIAWSQRCSVIEKFVCLERRSMPKEHALSASTSGHQIEISNLVRAHGITRDQARRLIKRFGNNRAKLSEAARTLKARSAAPRKAALQLNSDRSESPRSPTP